MEAVAPIDEINKFSSLSAFSPKYLVVNELVVVSEGTISVVLSLTAEVLSFTNADAVELELIPIIGRGVVDPELLVVLLLVEFEIIPSVLVSFNGHFDRLFVCFSMELTEKK